MGIEISQLQQIIVAKGIEGVVDIVGGGANVDAARQKGLDRCYTTRGWPLGAPHQHQVARGQGDNIEAGLRNLVHHAVKGRFIDKGERTAVASGHLPLEAVRDGIVSQLFQAEHLRIFGLVNVEVEPFAGCFGQGKSCLQIGGRIVT